MMVPTRSVILFVIFQSKIFSYDEKKPLGERNIMHDKSVGDYIVYMDDDYYPPQRIEHAVNMLKTHKRALCAGANLYLL